MLKFIKAYENKTVTGLANFKGLTPSQTFTPSIYLGSPNGFKLNDEDTYDVNDEYSIKHLKITVSDLLQTGQMFLLDTLDLYSGCNHLSTEGSYNNPIDNFFLNNNQVDKTIPSPAAPVKFNRVHFYGSVSGISREYYSIFLVGNPVPVDSSADEFPEGPASMYPQHEYGGRLIIGGDAGDYPFKVKRIYYEGDNLKAELFPGRWVHKRTVTQSLSDVLLNSSSVEQYIYAEYTDAFTVVLSSSETYPLSSSQYLRRALAYVKIDVQGKKILEYYNIQLGDIVTW